DGLNNKSFHKNCDNKGATIWIAKIQGSTQLIGGYNPLDWSGNEFKRTTDSFLFNFTDGKNISTALVKHINVNGADYAVLCRNDCGPHMADLKCTTSNNWTYEGQEAYYPNLDIPAQFIVEGYEVFQVTKK
ncbi:hypothetical protein C1645_829327, partial [Glomus cerebriforme]